MIQIPKVVYAGAAAFLAFLALWVRFIRPALVNGMVKLFTRRRFGLVAAQDQAADPVNYVPEYFVTALHNCRAWYQDEKSGPAGAVAVDIKETAANLARLCEIGILLNNRMRLETPPGAPGGDIVELLEAMLAQEKGRAAILAFMQKGFFDPFPARKGPLPTIPMDPPPAAASSSSGSAAGEASKP